MAVVGEGEDIRSDAIVVFLAYGDVADAYAVARMTNGSDHEPVALSGFLGLSLDCEKRLGLALVCINPGFGKRKR